jgi:hypothetical protein
MQGHNHVIRSPRLVRTPSAQDVSRPKRKSVEEEGGLLYRLGSQYGTNVGTSKKMLEGLESINKYVVQIYG